MTECQGCGAWNERRRTLCVLCGTPLAETDEWDAAAEPPPLPPLPDGGLSVTMPSWLRAVPGTPEPHAPASLVMPAAEEEGSPSPPPLVDSASEVADVAAMTDSREPAPVDVMSAEPPLGSQADPRTFLRDDDFPRWIRELPALPPRPVPPVAVIAPPPEPAVLVALPADPAPPLLPQPAPAPAPEEASPRELLPAEEAGAPLPVATSSAAIPAPPTTGPERRREAWETPLLVVLVVGVVAAVIWALLANGLLGSGL